MWTYFTRQDIFRTTEYVLHVSVNHEPTSNALLSRNFIMPSYTSSIIYKCCFVILSGTPKSDFLYLTQGLLRIPYSELNVFVHRAPALTVYIFHYRTASKGPSTYTQYSSLKWTRIGFLKSNNKHNDKNNKHNNI